MPPDIFAYKHLKLNTFSGKDPAKGEVIIVLL